MSDINDDYNLSDEDDDLNELDQITGVSFTSVVHDSLNVDQYDNYFGESFASAQNNNFQEPEIRIVKESSTKNSRKSKDLTEQHKEYEKHNEKLRLYRKKVYDDWKSTLLLRSGMGTFKPIATLIKNQITKRNVLSNIYGLENVLIIFVTNSMCSFAVFDSRKLISREQIVSQSENVAQYTKAKGNYFIASLDNYQNISFCLKTNSTTQCDEFLGLYKDREVGSMILNINHFGCLSSGGKFTFVNDKEMDNYYKIDSYNEFGIEQFVGKDFKDNEIDLDSVLIFIGEKKKDDDKKDQKK